MKINRRRRLFFRAITNRHLLRKICPFVNETPVNKTENNGTFPAFF